MDSLKGKSFSTVYLALRRGNAERKWKDSTRDSESTWLEIFSRVGEDHCGIPMERPPRLSRFDNAKFSRLKLTRILKLARSSAVQVMYPFPDYKLARVVLTDRAVAAL